VESLCIGERATNANEATEVAIYIVRIRNPIINQEVMKIETEDWTLALVEAEYYSKRHGVAEVFDSSSAIKVARFRYGVEEAAEA
jgi:hypothetical protein